MSVHFDLSRRDALSGSPATIGLADLVRAARHGCAGRLPN